MSNITLTVGENKFSGWQRGVVVSSLLTLADSFELMGYGFGGAEIKADDECILSIDDEPIITGYVDEIRVSLSGEITIIGRDKTRDLVDCQALTTSFLNQSVLSIVSGIASDFGITASGDRGPTVKQFVVSRDETAADAIGRLLTNYGMIITSDKDGNVIIREPGEFDNPGLAIKQNVNIKDAVAIFSGASRFSSVNVFGQNFLTPGFSASATGSAPTVRPRRVFLADEVNQSDCQLAANRIKDFSDGSAVSVDCTILTLDYLPAGTAVSFESEDLGINSEMLIETVKLEFDQKDSYVRFNLVSPQKYGGDPIASEFLR